MGIRWSLCDNDHQVVVADPDQVYVDAIQRLLWRNHVTDAAERIAVVEIQRNPPVPIIDDFLYLSGATAMLHTARLDALGITHVLNVAGDQANETAAGTNQKERIYKTIPAHDRHDYKMLENHWEDCHAFIQSCREAGGRCVVHCQAGANRSGVIVAAEFMLAEQKPILDVVCHCRIRRGDIFLCNEGFVKELVHLARRHNLLGPERL